MERTSGIANTAKRILAYLLAALFVLALPLSILSNNTLLTLFSPEDISEPVVSLLLLRGGVRDQLTDTLISEVWAEGQPGADAEALKYLTVQDRLKITQILFPKDWVREQVRDNLDILILWIETEDPLPQLIVDLVPIQENLLHGGSNRIAELVVESWPQCSLPQARQLERVLEQATSVRFEYCRPEDELFQRLIDHVDQRIQQYIDSMPPDVPLFKDMFPEQSFQALESFRQNMLRLMRILNTLKPLPFLFMGMIMTLVIRSWRDLGRWWGIPLGSGALLTLFLVFLGHGIGPGILNNSMGQAEQIPEIQEQIVEALWDLSSKILNQSALQAIVTGIVGIILFVLPRGSKEKTSESLALSIGDDKISQNLDEIPPPPQVEPFDPSSFDPSNREDSAQ